MFHKEYSNFVRPTTVETSTSTFKATANNGETVKKLYLEEVGNLLVPLSSHSSHTNCEKTQFADIIRKQRRKTVDIKLSNPQLFKCVQNNEVDILREALDNFPDKINIVDEFGWSLLMIACQANSVEIVKELLNRGIDTTVRDKAGNSAQSLVIKNRNFIIADILLKYKKERKTHEEKNIKEVENIRLSQMYVCEICDNKIFDNKYEHLSSTVHNINASKGKKIPTCYVIPESNKGYQIMLKVGWDKETGLGPDGSGKKYPIKAIQKKDKKGLGHKNKKVESLNVDSVRQINKDIIYKERDRNRRIEINFRREFY